jgi:hypothetical protein
MAIRETPSEPLVALTNPDAGSSWARQEQRRAPAVWLALCCLLYRRAHHYAESENEQQPDRRKRPFSSRPVHFAIAQGANGLVAFLQEFPPAPMKSRRKNPEL